MKMKEIEIAVGAGVIELIQQDGNDEMSIIVITPEQAELVCAWIMGAAKSMGAE